MEAEDIDEAGDEDGELEYELPEELTTALEDCLRTSRGVDVVGMTMDEDMALSVSGKALQSLCTKTSLAWYQSIGTVGVNRQGSVDVSIVATGKRATQGRRMSQTDGRAMGRSMAEAGGFGV